MNKEWEMDFSCIGLQVTHDLSQYVDDMMDRSFLLTSPSKQVLMCVRAGVRERWQIEWTSTVRQAGRYKTQNGTNYARKSWSIWSSLV